MIMRRSVQGALLAVGIVMLAPGCFSLSLGTRNCTGESPEVKARLNALESRVSALEQMIGAPTDGVTPAMMPTDATSHPGRP